MTEQPPPPPRSAIAGRYVLLDQIGHGGMGTVWRAWDIRTEDHVAAKVLAHHSSPMLLRFVREQGLRIAHPHVVAPTSWAAEDDAVVFTMDLVRGGSLETLLGEYGSLPQAYAALLLDQLLAALAAVHAAGVVHRDVKPANILLEPTGPGRPHLRLGDFGVAVPLEDARLTHVPGVVGTEGYMPPEQERSARPDPRQDLYAAGAVITQCITGHRPVPGARIAVPPGPLQQILTALTDPDPACRPPTAEIARHHLPALPEGTVWLGAPNAPMVPDRITAPARPPRPGPTRVRVRPAPPDRSWLKPPASAGAGLAVDRVGAAGPAVTGPGAPNAAGPGPGPGAADARPAGAPFATPDFGAPDTLRPDGFAVDPIAAEAMHIRMAQRSITPLPSHLQVDPVPPERRSLARALGNVRGNVLQPPGGSLPGWAVPALAVLLLALLAAALWAMLR